MDITEAKDLIYWIIGILLTSVTAGILGIINVVRAGKLLPKDMKGADLSNKSKEVSIAEQYDELATRAAEKVLKMQERLDKVEGDSETMELGFVSLKKDYAELKEKIDTQAEIIEKQAIIIEEQSKRLDLQEKKIKDQQIEIELLKCELENAKAYNDALIEQMKIEKIIPVDLSSVKDIKDCEKIKDKKMTRVTKKERPDGNKAK